MGRVERWKKLYREDDMFAWIVFLGLISPVPFVYSLVDSNWPSSGQVTVAFWSFALTGFGWVSLSWIHGYLAGMGRGSTPTEGDLE